MEGTGMEKGYGTRENGVSGVPGGWKGDGMREGSSRRSFGIVPAIGMVLAFLAVGPGATVKAKSVFVVASHQTSKIKAYRIEPEGLAFQTTIAETESFGLGATGLCVWPSVDRLFVTYEGSPTIAWASTKTLGRDPDDEIEAAEGNLAGLVADETKGLLYVIGRETGHLLAYEFDIRRDTLVPAQLNGQPYLALEGLDRAFGIALDPDGGPEYFGIPSGLLFVADGSPRVRYYDTTTWALVGQVDVGRPAVGIDVDGAGSLYTGSFFEDSTYLVRTRLDGDPNDPETRIEKDLGVAVTDIAVDRATGLLYLTTQRTVDGHRGTVEVYDPTNWHAGDPNSLVWVDTENDADFDGPAGLDVGSQYKPANGTFLRKTDDVAAAVVPGDVYHYRLAYHAGPTDEPNVVITDILPAGVDFVRAEPDEPSWCRYDAAAHAYVWQVGYVTGADPNLYFELTVRVNEAAEPMGELVNTARAESEVSYVEDDEHTAVDCWGPEVICVDADAADGGNGTSWSRAYANLQDALARAATGCGTEIWVAQGTYRPGREPTDTFTIPPGVSVYGGFRGDETSRDQRDWRRYKTILSGYINDQTRNDTVVTMGHNALLDGFIVEKGKRGITNVYGEDLILRNCRICNNFESGVRVKDGDAIIEWCAVASNGKDGIYHNGTGRSLILKNTQVLDNTRNATPTIIDSVIHGNGTASTAYDEYYGIRIYRPTDPPVLRNNTIVGNINEGIYFEGSSSDPDVRNCILYANNADDGYVDYHGFRELWNCCVTDANDLNKPAVPMASGRGREPAGGAGVRVFGYRAGQCAPGGRLAVRGRGRQHVRGGRRDGHRRRRANRERDGRHRGRRGGLYGHRQPGRLERRRRGEPARVRHAFTGLAQPRSQ